MLLTGSGGWGSGEAAREERVQRLIPELLGHRTMLKSEKRRSHSVLRKIKGLCATLESLCRITSIM